MADFTGSPRAGNRRFAVVASRFNEPVTAKLVDGALEALQRHGAARENIDLVWVPGAWELPIAARRLLATDRYDALVALGAVVRGETPHFDYVAGEAARRRARRHRRHMGAWRVGASQRGASLARHGAI